MLSTKVKQLICSGDNPPIRVIVTVFGVFLGIAGAIHGLFEVLQGEKLTNGLFIEAINPPFWKYGTEGALTILPSFLLAGIITTSIGLLLIIWSIFFIQTRYGSTIFLLLNICSVLVGGGIFQIVAFMFVWSFSTRITGSLAWWEKNSLRFHRIPSQWLLYLIIAVIAFVLAQTISIFGVIPGITNPESILLIIFLLLSIMLLSLVIAFISGIKSILASKSSNS